MYSCATSTPCTWEISYDLGTQAWILDGLSGIVPNPAGLGGGNAQFLGLSPGVAATPTDPGAVTFLPGTNGTPAAAAMIYDFWDGLVATAPGGINELASLQSTLVRIEFVPATGGGYAWAAF